MGLRLGVGGQGEIIYSSLSHKKDFIMKSRHLQGLPTLEGIREDFWKIMSKEDKGVYAFSMTQWKNRFYGLNLTKLTLIQLN